MRAFIFHTKIYKYLVYDFYVLVSIFTLLHFSSILIVFSLLIMKNLICTDAAQIHVR